MISAARRLIPAIRWDPKTGFEGQRAHFAKSLELGCGGYILFGGEVKAVRELVAELRERSGFPLLIASDLERGAGQQFAEATGLPPLAAIGASLEQNAAARAAKITARDALSLGVNWVLAPVCDLDLEIDNPIIGTRSLGADTQRVSELAAEWIDACQAAGALACAKHFPGHGRTSVDSHAALPNVATSAAELRATDLAPFAAAIEAGVASILTAHIAFPSLDPSGMPATISRPILHDLLRKELGFKGIIVTDAMIMEGVLRGSSEEDACVRALAAGCDLVLYPVDVEKVARAAERAVETGVIDSQEHLESIARRDQWATWATANTAGPSESDREWARNFALSCVQQIRGEEARIPREVNLFLVDDDVGGPYPAPSREPLRVALLDLGIEARWVNAASASTHDTLIITLFGDIRSWKGRAGYSAESVNSVSRAVAANPGALVFQFSHPRLAQELPASVSNVINAWGGEKVMQEAAARWLAAHSVT